MYGAAVMLKILKAILSDIRYSATWYYSYLYWNAHGTRVTPESFIHPKANVASTCSFFGHSRVYETASIDHFTYGTSCIITNATIGKFCSIAYGSNIGPDNHPVNHISTSPKTYNVEGISELRSPAIIGSDVWIGANAVILPGITIGHGCIVGAGAIVTKSVDPFTIVGGIPARPIGKRDVDRRFINAIEKTNDPEELGELAWKVRDGKF